MKDKEYHIQKVKGKETEFDDPNFWNEIPSLVIDNYLWMNNKYEPKVEAKICYSDKYLFVYFNAHEKEITTTYTKINDPVYKDSCVEFFVNLFPNETNEYFNFEVNAIGTMYVGFGAIGNRKVLAEDDVNKIEIRSTIKKPIVGTYGNNNWEVFCKIPFSIFENNYKLKFNSNAAKGNLYKCGDDTKYEHYGTWNNIISKKPNFHLPNYFGNLMFL
ncbi:MAG: carbohydrate-binding family 9-like protein [Melioribacteraceae bacterium]